MRFSSPETIDAAITLLATDSDARILAGGTDLIVQLQSGLRQTNHAVDIKRIPELNSITRQSDGSWTLGAALCSAELNEHTALKQQWPGVLEAADLIGSMQVQSRATLAGNICNASPAADSVPALIAANATATIVGVSGERTVPIESIATAPGKTILETDELISTINLPPKPVRSGEAYQRLIPRTEMDIAVVSAGINLTIGPKGVITHARVALGAVAATALRVDKAEEALIGNTLDQKTLDALAQVCSAACKPINDKRGTIEYRTQVAGVLAKRAAKLAYTRAGGKL